MRELRELLARLRALGPEGRHGAVLATVVAVEGSAYRREGARLLVETAEGVDEPFTGVLSGGCLERDLLAPARRVAASGVPELAVYDLLADEEAVWGFGLGCAGRVTVLLESATGGAADAVVAALERAIEARVGARLRTRIAPRSDGGSAISLGRELVSTDPAADLLPGPARSTVAPDGALVLDEAIEPPVHLVVAGTERDVPALLRLAGGLGWERTVVETKPTAAARRRVAAIDPAIRIVEGAPRGLAERIELGPRVAVVVATHRYLDDLAILGELAAAPRRPAYLGLLGPANRRERLLDDLARRGHRRDGALLATLRGPAGLDLGGRSPEEVALSIVAEVQSVLSTRPAPSAEPAPGRVAADR